jgi:GH15 family glucan-1,4-alpha-glucosidase
MLWSFPALLDTDPVIAREALEYALTFQLRNTGTHSRFIDGVALEDGFQLDEADAPIVALASYVNKTNDTAFLEAHRTALIFLRDRLASRYDASIGLYTSLQDSQDEYQKRPYLTYDNVLTWRALLDMAALFDRLREPDQARALTQRAADLKTAILKHCVAPGPPGSTGTMFAASTDGTSPLFVEIPPGSLMRLPALGFVPETDSVFERTYEWLHSPNYKYSYASEPYGLPGSYRVPFTTSWAVADHLLLKQGRERAMKVLHDSPWDGGIFTEGVNPATGILDTNGRAFATAAGYLAHALCEIACTDKQ